MRFDFSVVSEILNFESDDLFQISSRFDIDPSFQWFDADLRGVDFRGRDLNGFDLSKSNVSQANFDECELFFCDLRDAKVENANFKISHYSYAAIWPLNISDNFSSIEDQKVLRQIRSVYDLVNTQWRDVYEGINSKYDLAFSLDTIGDNISSGIYILAHYVLLNPAKRNEDEDESFFERIRENRDLPGPISEVMQWIIQNKISKEVAYAFERIDQSYISVPNFFWREKGQFDHFDLEYKFIHGDGRVNIDKEIQEKLSMYSSRDLPWRWALVKNIEFACIARNDPKFDVVDGIRGLLSSFPSYFTAEVNYHFVWPYYLCSIHSGDSNLRKRMRQVSESIFSEFWGGEKIADEARETLKRHPNFWGPGEGGMI